MLNNICSLTIPYIHISIAGFKNVLKIRFCLKIIGKDKASY